MCTFATANRKTRVCNTKKDALVAQLVEHLTLNQRVQGSNPCRRTKRETHQGFLFFFSQISHGWVFGPADHEDLAEKELKSYYLVCPAGLLALEGIKEEVFACNDTMRAQTGGDGMERLLGGVILLTEVAEPYMAQLGCGALSEELGGDGIVKMSHIALYARLQTIGVSAMKQHVEVVVGFKHEVVAAHDVMADDVGGMAAVGDDGEDGACNLYGVAHMTYAVMGNGEAGDAEVVDLEGGSLVDGLDEIAWYLTMDIVVMVDALMGVLGGIDRYEQLLTERPHGLDMVSMGMGDEDGSYVGEGDASVVECLLDGAHAESAINHQA